METKEEQTKPQDRVAKSGTLTCKVSDINDAFIKKAKNVLAQTKEFDTVYVTKEDGFARHFSSKDVAEAYCKANGCKYATVTRNK